MSNIQFEEGYNQINSQYYRGGSSERGLTAWLIKKGIVKDAKSAQVILLVVAIVCFAAAFLVIKSNDTYPVDPRSASLPIFEGPLPPAE